MCVCVFVCVMLVIVHGDNDDNDDDRDDYVAYVAYVNGNDDDGGGVGCSGDVDCIGSCNDDFCCH